MNHLLIFAILEFIGFIVYASMYSSAMQDISALHKKSRIKIINQDSIRAKIQKKQRFVKELKWYIYGFLSLAVLTHLLLIMLLGTNGWIEFMFPFVVGLGTLLLIVIITWMKGAGSIDNTPKNHKSPWM
ncbi:MAG: hypothetical protein NXI10_14990 [bacterium]|nr:hypothetical protein [bacterium]